MAAPLHVSCTRYLVAQNNRHISRCTMDKRSNHGVANRQTLHECLALGRDSSMDMSNLKPSRMEK